MTANRSVGWRVVAAEFETSAPNPQSCPPGDLPEVAIAGRSNVGKSSLLNAIAGRTGLARVSRTPGRTQLLNVFRLEFNDGHGNRRSLRCVDLPGYGYAAAHRSVRERFAPMIEAYLEQRTSLRALVLLMDARRGPDERDQQLIDYLGERGIGCLAVATKVDKVGASERGTLAHKWSHLLGLNARDVLLTSASANLGLVDDGRGSSLTGELARLAQVKASLDP